MLYRPIRDTEMQWIWIVTAILPAITHAVSLTVMIQTLL